MLLNSSKYRNVCSFDCQQPPAPKKRRTVKEVEDKEQKNDVDEVDGSPVVTMTTELLDTSPKLEMVSLHGC